LDELQAEVALALLFIFAGTVTLWPVSSIQLLGGGNIWPLTTKFKRLAPY
jgi:hypothetical protein